MAATKLAERVAAERKEEVGKTVGYCIAGSHHRAAETVVTYCTIGYFLQVCECVYVHVLCLYVCTVYFRLVVSEE